jgi:hypothetical protein
VGTYVITSRGARGGDEEAVPLFRTPAGCRPAAPCALIQSSPFAPGSRSGSPPRVEGSCGGFMRQTGGFMRQGLCAGLCARFMRHGLCATVYAPDGTDTFQIQTASQKPQFRLATKLGHKTPQYTWLIGIVGLTSLRLQDETPLETCEQFRQVCFESLRYSFDVYQRDVSHSALNATVVGPVQPATLGGLFLIDPLRLTEAANRTAKTNPDIHGHRLQSSRRADDGYTPDESH